MVEVLGLNSELERDIIALALSDNNFFFDVYEYLEKGHFSDSETGKTWTIIKKFFQENQRVPKEKELRYFLSKLDIELDENYFLPDKLIRDTLREETLELVRVQEFKKFIFESADQIDSGNPDYGKMQDKIKSIVNIQSISDLGLSYFDIDERFQKIQSLSVDRVPTGIPIVDTTLKGGLAAKELVAFAAPSGVGKSFLLVIAGAHMLKHNKNVLHYTMEMSEEITSLRYDSALLHATETEILSDIEATKARITGKQKNIKSNLIIKEFPTKGASVSTLRAHIQKMREQQNFLPDVIIVDYGDILKSTRRYNSRYDEQGAIFQELRGLAQEMEVPILTATQTNRGSVDKEVIGQEDLGDSYDKARIMDALFTIVQRKDEKEDGLFRIYSAKVRNAADGKLYGYRIDYSRATLEEIKEVNLED